MNSLLCLEIVLTLRPGSSRPGLSGYDSGPRSGNALRSVLCKPVCLPGNTDPQVPLPNHCIRISGAEAENLPLTGSKGDAEAGDPPSSDGEVPWNTMSLL